MIQFVSGYALGFVSGMAVRRVSFARRWVALGLSTTIAALDLVHQAVAGEESLFRRMLDEVEKTQADVHAKADVHARKKVTPSTAPRRLAA